MSAEPSSVPWLAFAAGVRRFVASRVPAQDAEDVAQEVLVRLHQGVARLRESGRAEAWVYGVARRAVADYHRLRARHGRVGSGECVEALPAGLSGAVHEEVLSWIRPFAERLPAGYREALLMADFEGRPQQAVAQALGLSLSGAKSRIQRARRLLGEQLQQCCELHFGGDGRVTGFERRDDDCSC